MSFIHLLFPPGEVAIPDRPSREALPSARRVKFEEGQGVRWNSDYPSKRRHMGYSHQRSLQAYAEHIAAWRRKHLLSKTQSRVSGEPSSSIRTTYREPIVSHHRGHRVSTPSSYGQEAQSRGSTPHSVGESASSPSTINADRDSPSSSEDSIDTPSTPGSVCDRSRSGPFGHIFDGLRLTDNERDLLEELTQPDTTEPPGQKRKRAPTTAEIVQTLSHMTYADFINQSPNTAPDPGSQTDDDRSSIATEPVSIRVPEAEAGDDERAERESDKSSTIDEAEPSITHRRTVPTVDAIVPEKNQISLPG